MFLFKIDNRSSHLYFIFSFILFFDFGTLACIVRLFIFSFNIFFYFFRPKLWIFIMLLNKYSKQHTYFYTKLYSYRWGLVQFRKKCSCKGEKIGLVWIEKVTSPTGRVTFSIHTCPIFSSSQEHFFLHWTSVTSPVEKDLVQADPVRI